MMNDSKSIKGNSTAMIINGQSTHTNKTGQTPTTHRIPTHLPTEMSVQGCPKKSSPFNERGTYVYAAQQECSRMPKEACSTHEEKCLPRVHIRLRSAPNCKLRIADKRKHIRDDGTPITEHTSTSSATKEPLSKFHPLLQVHFKKELVAVQRMPYRKRCGPSMHWGKGAQARHPPSPSNEIGHPPTLPRVHIRLRSAPNCIRPSRPGKITLSPILHSPLPSRENLTVSAAARAARAARACAVPVPAASAAPAVQTALAGRPKPPAPLIAKMKEEAAASKGVGKGVSVAAAVAGRQLSTAGAVSHQCPMCNLSISEAHYQDHLTAHRRKAAKFASIGGVVVAAVTAALAKPPAKPPAQAPALACGGQAAASKGVGKGVPVAAAVAGRQLSSAGAGQRKNAILSPADAQC